MKKYAVLYYSYTGNSKFMADKIAGALHADVKAIAPRAKNLLWLFLLSLMRIKMRTKIKDTDLAAYDEVVVIGPIWGGLLISPLRSMLMQLCKLQKPLHFAVCCETPEAEKDGKCGYRHVLTQAAKVSNGWIKNTAAFSSDLVRKETDLHTIKILEKVKVTDGNYQGAIKERLENFVASIKAQ